MRYGCMLIVCLLSWCQSMNGQTQTVSEYQWLNDLIDSISNQTSICVDCQIPPLVRSYKTPRGNERFVLFYMCTDSTSNTYHFDLSGTLLSECIKDSNNRECEANIVTEGFTLANSIKSVWSCEFGFNCLSADRSLLFDPYEIIVYPDLCDQSKAVLSVDTELGAYEWLLPDNTYQLDNPIQSGQEGTYRLVIWNDSGCTDTSYTTVDLSMMEELEIKGNKSICDDIGVTLSVPLFDEYLWYNGESTPKLNIHKAGEVSVVVTNAEGCSKELWGIVTDNRLLNLKIETSTNALYNGQSRDYWVVGDGDQKSFNEVKWIWENGEADTSVLSLAVVEPTELIAKITVDQGCIIQAEHLIEPQGTNRNIYLPNAIQPYSNQGNATFFLSSLGDLELSYDLTIYNRWGETMYSLKNGISNQPNLGWDGRKNGQVALSGTYAYQIQLLYPDGEIEQLSGSIQVIY